MDRSRTTRMRPRRRLGLLLVALVVAAAACGGPRGVSLSELAVNADYYDGRVVSASGVVLEFGGEGQDVPHHFVLQDAEVNRVELVPPDAAAPHVGSAVEVVGEYEFDEDEGRKLHVDSIEPVTVRR